MSNKSNFKCQDRLYYIKTSDKRLTFSKLFKYTIDISKKNRTFYYALIILSFFASFFIMHFNVGEKIQTGQLLPSAYQKKAASEFDFDIDTLKELMAK